MTAIANTLVLLTALLHAGFLYLEMFLWTTPRGRAIFCMDEEKAAATATLAANQGLYNGFLALGLVWGLLHPDPLFSFQLKVFFLLCVVAAAAYGAHTVSRRILYVQGAPAMLAMLFVALSY
ncbi:DUF1304 domain-containing protein [Rhizobium sp. TRM95111]|uniref:DUF1304 domain-containing protein n=1 Tax=Rhizobium alarense TaxID=2846851 RepID=UPI001F3E81B2|nr:DUF1304 domain-containing protein [Rhizobium alarense]MCF3640152.1 DUF1304 domain-containing protein [Rhizobium alarense]